MKTSFQVKKKYLVNEKLSCVYTPPTDNEIFKKLMPRKDK